MRFSLPTLMRMLLTFYVSFAFPTVCCGQLFSAATNILLFIKTWSLQGSSDFPMPKEFLDTRQLITKEGFGFECHEVTTEDGYILSLTRILPAQEKNPVGRPPVLMVHGVMAASDQWVARGDNEDLAFLLTLHGFDVWLADLRGNYYGRRHIRYSSGDSRFWDFSFHEIGIYDLPAFVDFILGKTSAARVGYVGHSMGTTVFFIFASVRPEYNSKISASVLLAPVGPAYPPGLVVNNVIMFLLKQYNMLYGLFASAEIFEILSRTPRLVANVFKYCNEPSLQDVCINVLGQLIGEHRTNLNRNKIGFELSHIPAGTSLKTLHHFAQVFKFGFRMYDFGLESNLLKYNSTEPPEYPLHKITSPTYLMWGENDPLTTEQGVRLLAESIPGLKVAKLVEDHLFNHFDFIFGINTNATVYDDVIKFLANEMLT